MQCPELIELEQYLTGALDPPSRESIASHLSSCVPCASRLSEVEGNLGVVGAVYHAMAARAGDAASLAAPADIGSYRIIRELGRGGMGIVYEAEQQQTKRTVALKVLHPGYGVGDHREKLFRREVRVLGRLRHPGVAAIYEAGQTPQGRSFYVMELIEGRPLHEFVREEGLSFDDRLCLFRDAARAVAYAHQRGVIHRDLKPSNILVEADGAVKVLDFGLATILERNESASISVVSEAGRVFGTVPFMSPEQIRGHVHEIDVRSDVYSLGVILYLLLTGRLPYELDPANLPRAAAIICEAAPVLPSKLSPALRGDLETILLKALEKEPQRRYDTVAAFVDDVERYRHHEPITARPPSFTYQFRKLVRRHRLPVAFAATVLLLVLGFGATAGLLAVRLRAERNTAQLQQARAEAVNDFLQEMLAAVDPSVRPDNPDVTLHEVLDEAAAKIGTGFTGHPTVEVALRTTIGNAYRAIGRFDEARVHLQRAVELGEAVYADGHADLSLAMNKLARVLQEQGEYQAAEPLFRRALAMRKTLYGEKHEDVAVVLNNLGTLLHALGRGSEAQRLLRDALEMRRELFGPRHVAVANSLNNLAMVLYSQRRYDEAAAMYRESLTMDRELRGANHPHVATTMSNLALALRQVGRLDEAEALLRESLAVSRGIYGTQHPTLAVGLNNLAYVLTKRGSAVEAEALYRESLAMDRKLRGDRHPGVANTMANLADLLVTQGGLDEAERLHRNALEIRRETFGEEHPETLVSRYQLGGVELARGDFDNAEPRLAAVVAAARKTLDPGHWFIGAFLTRYGECLAKMQRVRDAEAALLEAYALCAASLGTGHERTLHAADALVALYESAGKTADADLWRARRNSPDEPSLASVGAAGEATD